MLAPASFWCLLELQTLYCAELFFGLDFIIKQAIILVALTGIAPIAFAAKIAPTLLASCLIIFTSYIPLLIFLEEHAVRFGYGVALDAHGLTFSNMICMAINTVIHNAEAKIAMNLTLGNHRAIVAPRNRKLIATQEIEKLYTQ